MDWMCDTVQAIFSRYSNFWYSCIFQGYVLVYDVTNFESFGTMDKLKKDIDKNKEKKDVRFLQNHIFHFRS